MSIQSTVNGVNVDQLFGTISAIKETPDLAKSNFRVTHKWLTGGHNRTTITDFHSAGQTRVHKQLFVLDADEPDVLLSQDQAPNPVEYALTALAACVTTSIVYHAAAHDIEIEAIESTIEGDLDLQGFLGLSDTVRPGYEGVRMTYKISADATKEELEKILQFGPKYSPVYDIFTNKVPVTVQLATE